MFNLSNHSNSYPRGQFPAISGMCHFRGVCIGLFGIILGFGSIKPACMTSSESEVFLNQWVCFMRYLHNFYLTPGDTSLKIIIQITWKL